MSATTFEAFLAKLYVDEGVRSKFLADPQGEAKRAGLTSREIEAVVKIDRVGLQLFSASLKRKRHRQGSKH
jgi:hypothetical protein